MASDVRDRVSNGPNGSATPRALLASAMAVLTALASAVLVAVTDAAWILGVAVCVLLLLLAAVLWEHVSETADGRVPAREAGPAAHRRLLLVAFERVSATRLAAILEGEPRASTAVLVVTPGPDRTWLRYWASDDDEGIEHARTVEEATLDALRHECVPAAGHVGSGDPLTAIEDALRFFDADRIVIAMHAGRERHYPERDLGAEVERRFGVATYAIDAGRA
jgi:hypothetical protein